MEELRENVSHETKVIFPAKKILFILMEISRKEKDGEDIILKLLKNLKN